jgi:hypothetical protein
VSRPGGESLDLGLAELVNRVLDRGAVISGEVLISVADVDLIYLGLRVVLASAETAHGRRVALGVPTDRPRRGWERGST